MCKLENLVQRISRLAEAQGLKRAAERLFRDRAYLALGPERQPELFLRGSRASFEGVKWRRALSWDEFTIVESDSPLEALVVRTRPTEEGQRLMAHVAYEAWRILEANPDVDNAALIDEMGGVLQLVLSAQILSSEEQIGLMGELQLLIEVLEIGSTKPAERRSALESWCGYERSRRDFHASWTSVEVKSSSDGFTHRVRMEQLDLEAEEERLFLCSVRVKRDRSATLKIGEQIAKALKLLEDEDLKQQLKDNLEKYGNDGYRFEDEGLYKISPGFFVERIKLREIDATSPILRKGSFREGEPPSSVSEIGYVLDARLVGDEVTRELRKKVLRCLAGCPNREELS